MPTKWCYHLPALQVGDEDTAEQVLQHAWAALDAGEHKQLSGRGTELPLFLKRFNAGGLWLWRRNGGSKRIPDQG